MREGISIEVSASNQERLATVMADHNNPQKHVRIILATAEGCGTAAIMRRAEVSKPRVWRWREGPSVRGCRPVARQDAKTRSAEIATDGDRPG
jgi:hypothetical protein